MFIVNYKDGQWQDPQIKPYGPLNVLPSLHSLHYGQAIFEGMKAYKGPNDESFLFRPEQNAKRLNKSAVRMCMPEMPEKLFLEGLYELLKIDQKNGFQMMEHHHYISVHSCMAHQILLKQGLPTIILLS